MKTNINDLQCTIHTSLWYMDEPWYDLSYIEFSLSGIDSDNFYHLSYILWFVRFLNQQMSAIVTTSEWTIHWKNILNKIFIDFALSRRFCRKYKAVLVSWLVYSFVGFNNLGSNNPGKHFCRILKRNWSHYFNNQITVAQCVNDNCDRRIDIGHTSEDELKNDDDSV